MSVESQEDGINDAFLSGDGKADTGGITEGSTAACGVLYVANTESKTVLRNEVGLTVRAADNIVAFRQGDNETDPADDQVFSNLAQLDAIPYIGPISFAKLAAYAASQDLDCPGPDTGAVGDPFSPSSCTGSSLSDPALVALVGNSGEVILGTGNLVSRMRSCTNATGCGEWQAATSLRAGQEMSLLYFPYNQFAIRLGAEDDHTQYLTEPMWINDSTDDEQLEIYNSIWRTVLVEFGGDTKQVTMTATMREHCARVASPTLRVGNTTTWREHQYAIVTTF